MRRRRPMPPEMISTDVLPGRKSRTCVRIRAPASPSGTVASIPVRILGEYLGVRVSARTAGARPCREYRRPTGISPAPDDKARWPLSERNHSKDAGFERKYLRYAKKMIGAPRATEPCLPICPRSVTTLAQGTRPRRTSGRPGRAKHATARPVSRSHVGRLTSGSARRVHPGRSASRRPGGEAAGPRHCPTPRSAQWHARHHTARQHTARHHTARHHTARHHTARHHTARHHTAPSPLTGPPGPRGKSR